MLLFIALLGCPANTPPPVEPTPVPADPVPVAGDPPVPAPTDPASVATDPAALAAPADLYAQCRDRLELPEVDAECTADADCSTAGCGGEVCTTKVAAASGLMFTCEDAPCFHVVTGCGCHAGKCSWTVAESATPERMIIKKGPAPQ